MDPRQGRGDMYITDKTERGSERGGGLCGN